MARSSANSAVASSLLDRLKNSDGAAGRTTAAQTLRELKQSVLNDLENLLNTRWRCRSWPPSLAELDRSLVNYGIPDFSSGNLSGAAKEEFRKILEKTIRHFEPRFANVTVEALPAKDGNDRILRFGISAVLLAEPAPEPVKFETALEPASAAFQVRRVER